MSSAIEVLKRLVKEEGLKMSGNEMIYFNKDEFNALKEALLALEQKDVKDTEIRLLHKQITNYEIILNGLNEWLESNISQLLELEDKLKDIDENYYANTKIRRIVLEEVLKELEEGVEKGVGERK